MKKIFIKRIFNLILLIGFVLVSIISCTKKTPNAEEIVKEYLKKELQPVDIKSADIFTELVKTLKSAEKSKSNTKVDLEIPFELGSVVNTDNESDDKSNNKNGSKNDSKNNNNTENKNTNAITGSDKLNGKIIVSADIEFTNMGYIEGYKTFAPHYLYKVICDYKLSVGGSFAPMGMGFDGRLQSYLKLEEDLNTLSVYYKLNDYDSNWYEYIIGNVKEALVAMPDLIKSRDEIIKDNEDRKNSQDDKERQEYIKEKSLEYYDHIVSNAISTATITNSILEIPELNIKDAYEISYTMNCFDDKAIEMLKDIINKNMEKNGQNDDGNEEFMKGFDKVCNQLVNKFIVNGTIDIVDGKKSKYSLGDYSVIKETIDCTNIKIDYSDENVMFNMGFDKGELETTHYNDFETEYIPDNVLQDSLVVDQIDLNETLSSVGKSL